MMLISRRLLIFKSLRVLHKVDNRFYSSVNVPLSFTKYDINKTKTVITKRNPPLIIHHGLFGSKQNWKSLAKNLSANCNCEVYVVDARNHGDSPHNEIHTYNAMAKDLIQFIGDHKIKHPILMGHSMGGKVVMNVALHQPGLLSKLIVVDIAPVYHKLSREYDHHIEAMREIQARQLTKQKEADKILQKFEPDLIVRQFLLTNLKKDRATGVYQFRIPFDILGRSLNHMGEFSNNQQQYTGPTLFITGGASPFRKPFVNQSEIIKQQFPNSHIMTIEGAGHWVHTEKPQEFLGFVTVFINSAVV
ncbi:MAG: Alpha/Beta hydrolase protein [Benjaminiella poitrasii]|nr:MAG: Alpha/Beta hydrolase protein [Benjaminiella poitrasii]